MKGFLSMEALPPPPKAPDSRTGKENVSFICFNENFVTAVKAIVTISGLPAFACFFLSEEPFSYGYGGTGKKSTNSRLKTMETSLQRMM